MSLRQKMTILVGYDGSTFADNAIDDLAYAGLPEKGVAHVFSIAELWLPDPQSFTDKESTLTRDSITEFYRRRGEKALSEARILADYATGRIRDLLPDWEIDTHIAYGSPSREIVRAAKELDVDLIILGSQGHSTLTPCSIGSIANKVLSEAGCSVRLVHRAHGPQPTPPHLVVGFDGSEGSQAALNAIAERSWPPGTEMRLIYVAEPTEPRSVERFVKFATQPPEPLVGGLEPFTDIDEFELASHGLVTDKVIKAGNPKHVLIDEAWKLNADAIIVGANLWGANLETAQLGSTAAAIAARANCTVEVVRKRSIAASGAVFSENEGIVDPVRNIKHLTSHASSMVQANPW